MIINIKLILNANNKTGGEIIMKAQEAINKIKNERTTFMGRDVQKHNYSIEIRRELQTMAEQNDLAPAEYQAALDITMPRMSDSEKAAEIDEL